MEQGDWDLTKVDYETLKSSHALGADIDAPDTTTRCTPLHLAAAMGHENCIRILVELKANINALDTKGRTPLHCATEEGHENYIVI